MTTYLTLNPIQRGNRQYPKEKCEGWLRNFHTKLDFIDEEPVARALTRKVERSHIIWAHDHRNEQYHGGKKGTPELDVLEIARSAALWIFGLLFDVPNAERIVVEVAQPKPSLPERKRIQEYDKAIDSEFGALQLGGGLYGASELLFNTDYEAYRELGASLVDDAESVRQEKIA